MQIKFKKLSSTAKPFMYMTEGAACADVYADETVILTPNMVVPIGTGIAVEIPENYELQIRSRSGLALKGVMVANGIGTIDSDYRGEVRVLLYNTTDTDITIRKGDRIAQAIPACVIKTEYKEVDILGNTNRDINGFGSTGA